MKLEFPKNFLWGSATASHQVEGNNNNNWSEWEKKNANILALEELPKHVYLQEQGSDEPDNYYLGVVSKKWYAQNFEELKEQMTDPSNFVSGEAVDHFNRYKEDLSLAKELNLNSYRFSIEWSRIEPEKGKFNHDAINHYKNMIEYMRSLGIEPLVTLWHWSHPIWLDNEGGVLAKDFTQYFLKYAKFVVSNLKTDVKYWITVNEPDIYTLQVYVKGEWLDQKKSILHGVRSALRLISTHNKTYKLIKELDKESMVSFSKHDSFFEGTPGSLLSYVNAKLSYLVGIWSWHKLTLKYVDFIGVNIYMRTRYKGFRINNVNKRISDLGWELYPQAIYGVLMQLKKFKKPIIITENGLADRKDVYRGWYITEVVKNMYKAIQEGVDLRGYMHWSLMDNFEWSHGYWPEFGLIKVDRKTQKRTVRDSAKIYSKIAKENGIEVNE